MIKYLSFKKIASYFSLLQKNGLTRCLICFLFSIGLIFNFQNATAEGKVKDQSVFFNSQTREMLQKNIKEKDWAQQIKNECIKKANPWLELSDDELWSLVFSPNISRSWMVWSDGFCPSCKKDVKMYDWIIEPFKNPWKVQCPHCNELFPKNDFYSYYLSGMKKNYIFDPQLANKALLFNEEHPDKNDPIFQFGVDDGEGYIAGENRWRFIGAYLIYGQWKKMIVQGIYHLSLAYVITGEQIYAHKAGILLDRIADVYPLFDYSKQGYTYEKQDSIVGQGYVSVWHDACVETRLFALAYDQIFDGIKNDNKLVRFLSAKAKKYKFNNPKSNFKFIQSNIQNRILLDAKKNRHKIDSNFPQTDITFILINTILSWHDNQDKIRKDIKKMLTRATAVDGLSGEKGLASYSANVPKTLAQFLAFYNRLDENFLKSFMDSIPNLKKTFRFHINTWINKEYYPRVGDTGRFAEKVTNYSGARFDKNPLGTTYRDLPFISDYYLFWKFFEITGDTDYVKILYKKNKSSVDGLPFDLFVKDEKEFQTNVQKIIAEAGDEIFVESINMKNWCLALIRSGQGKNSRVLWIDYDIGGNHSQADGLNIGLFAKGLDVLPGFGYPPVQYGGWYSPRAIWYRKTAAHNTVVVNGLDQMYKVGQKETASLKQQLNPLKRHKKGETRLWSIGKQFKAIRIDGKNLHETLSLKQFERTLALIDIDSTDSYVLDIFRVVGGTDHAKFFHGYLGDVKTYGLSLQRDKDFGFGSQMSNFNSDNFPKNEWAVDWKIYDYYHYLEPGSDVHLKYRDLTSNINASIADTWIAFGFDRGDTLIKSLIIRKQSNKETATTFVGILEPYENFSKIQSVKRLPLHSEDGKLYSDKTVCVQVELANGEHDLLIAVDVENVKNPSPSFMNNPYVRQNTLGIETDAEICFIRNGEDNRTRKIVISNGSFVIMPGIKLKLKSKTLIFEIEISGTSYNIVAGETGQLKDIFIESK